MQTHGFLVQFQRIYFWHDLCWAMAEVKNMIGVIRLSLSLTQELRTEIFRKSIHLLIAMTPLLAQFNITLTMGLLVAGIIVYSFAESLRLQGRRIPLITGMTQMASRQRDQGKAVLGPITLGLGALLCLMLYPEPAATIGIYALAFGDGLSSVVGKLFGRTKIPFTGGKTLEGSLTAFVAIYVSAFAVCSRHDIALYAALVGTFLEMLPLEDLDNLVIPLGTAWIVAVLI
jgi:phytol kinase